MYSLGTAWVIGEAVPLDPQDPYYIRTHYQHRESKQPYLIHRNKHMEVTKTRRQRNMPQMKEQQKFPEKELNEMETSNLSDIDFKKMFIRRFKENLL